MTEQLACLDGQILPAEEAMVPATDEGLLRGDGVFEVMRVYEGLPFALEAHLGRLERSARNLRLPLDLEAVRSDVHRLLAQARTQPGRDTLRVVITRGGRRLLLTEPMAPHPPRVRLGTITYAPTRVLDGIKSLSYAANMLAGRLAREQGYDEALLVTPHGRVLEAPTSTLFWVTGGEVLTPPLEDHILASITRAAVLELSDGREAACTLADLQAADEAFLCSTIREIQPVASVDEHAFPAESPVAERLGRAFSEHVRAELGLS